MCEERESCSWWQKVSAQENVWRLKAEYGEVIPNDAFKMASKLICAEFLCWKMYRASILARRCQIWILGEYWFFYVVNINSFGCYKGCLFKIYNTINSQSWPFKPWDHHAYSLHCSPYRPVHKRPLQNKSGIFWLFPELFLEYDRKDF